MFRGQGSVGLVSQRFCPLSCAPKLSGEAPAERFDTPPASSTIQVLALFASSAAVIFTSKRFVPVFLQPSPPKNFIFIIAYFQGKCKSNLLIYWVEFRAVQKAETQIKGIEDAFNGIQLGIGTAVFQITVMPCADFAQI